MVFTIEPGAYVVGVGGVRLEERRARDRYGGEVLTGAETNGLSDIERILELMRTHDLAEFELEREGLKLRVRERGRLAHFMGAPVVQTLPIPAPAAPPAAQLRGAGVGFRPAAAPARARTTRLESVELAVVKSPIVGTFYRCPEPGAPVFVEIGSG